MIKKESSKNSFTGKRISSVSSLNNYIKEAYDIKSIDIKTCRTMYNIYGLVQADYGKPYDCSLTCITCILKYFLRNDAEEIYNTVVNCTDWYSYNGDKFGTVPIFVDNVFNRALSYYNLKFEAHNKTFKNVPLVGYSYNDIKKSIDKKLPVIINLSDDGRDYYSNHSITAIGYYEYNVVDSNNKSKTLYFIKVFDNWNKTFSFLDFQKLSKTSSITLLREK